MGYVRPVERLTPARKADTEGGYVSLVVRSRVGGRDGLLRTASKA